MELGRAKIALEHRYNTGHLAICNRVNFQRVYDLRDRVLPAWVDRREPDADEAMRSLLEISSKALGMCTPAQVAHYFHAKQADARPLIDRLIARGRLVTVTARLADGADHELVVHRDNLPLLQRAADGELRPHRTTFLSPFDSLFWASGRPAILAVPPSAGVLQATAATRVEFRTRGKPYQLQRTGQSLPGLHGNHIVRLRRHVDNAPRHLRRR